MSSEPSSVRSIWIEGDRIVPPPMSPSTRTTTIDLRGCIVMAGAIDAHTHIGGGKTNIARLMLPGRHSMAGSDLLMEQAMAPLSCPVPSTIEAGRRYLQMGYTACFEPAIIPCGARHAHLEMADTPFLDTGGYLMLGNESLLLGMLAEGTTSERIADYVAWMLKAHRCLAVKVVNPVGVSAWKWGGSLSDLESAHPKFGVTPRAVLLELAKAVDRLGLPHPIHVHCSNLGKPGNIRTTLETIDAVEGHRIHVTHAQFHCYGSDGPHGFSSAASQLIDRVNQNPSISIDVGQVLFGATATLSGDLPHQWENRHLASPKKGFFQEIETQGGCGVLPFRYRESQYVHGLQWSIGLELFLGIENPWQIFLTTDHPNGAPFTSYPHLIRLLMDRDFRLHCFEHLHPDVKATSLLPSLRREYTLEEIAVITRSAPAKSLGLVGHGSLAVDHVADLAVYEQGTNAEKTFAEAKLVMRRGKIVFRDGAFVDTCDRTSFQAKVEYDPGIEDFLDPIWREQYQQGVRSAVISDDEWEVIRRPLRNPFASQSIQRV